MGGLPNQQLPQSALGSRTPLQAMKDWHKLKPELFKKQPYHLPGCDSYGANCGKVAPPAMIPSWLRWTRLENVVAIGALWAI